MKPVESTRDGQHGILASIREAVLAITAEPRVDRSLRRLVEVARELADARYAAVGIPDDTGDGFAEFIYTGMSDEMVERIGPLPRRHGLLAAILKQADPMRSADIRKDPRFESWPDAHPRMSSFLGVPITHKGDAVGAFYLTDKIGAREFTEEDQQAIEVLAAHAAIAIETTRLYARNRELSAVEERNRLARDLHDSVTQTLFSMSLTAEAALQTIETKPEKARTELTAIRDLARLAVQEMRSLVFELRPPDLEREGLSETLRKHIDVVRRVSNVNVLLTTSAYERQSVDTEKEVFRIAQEALNNAVKHSQAEAVNVNIVCDNGVIRLEVTDDGVGFDADDPQVRGRRLGITSMEERADELGGELSIESAPGRTSVRLEVPID